jgi:peptide chain release factor 1
MRSARSGAAFSLEILDQRSGFVVLRATGPRVVELFGEEAGGHRWQRIPPNEKRGRVHTSTITVAVLPEPLEVEVVVSEKELLWSTCRGTGSGGQKRNKTETTVLLKHTPTGMTVRCETTRSQLKNRELALALLRARLWEAAQARQNESRALERKHQQGSGMRGDKRRTIRCQDGQVTDHLSGRKWELKAYLRGE